MVSLGEFVGVVSWGGGIEGDLYSRVNRLYVFNHPMKDK